VAKNTPTSGNRVSTMAMMSSPTNALTQKKSIYLFDDFRAFPDANAEVELLEELKLEETGPSKTKIQIQQLQLSSGGNGTNLSSSNTLNAGSGSRRGQLL
jgi:hypothetical protein